MKKQLLFLTFCLMSFTVLGQQGKIKGQISNSINNSPVPFANIGIEGTATATVSDVNGNYLLSGLNPGLYNISVSCVGFRRKRIFEVEVSATSATVLDIAMDEVADSLKEVVVTASPFNKTEESPVSLKTIGSSEIDRNPGGNRDISKVVQSLPGVASTVSFRNDIIIRGGAPNENRFYLDGIEVPNINHFATQGSSGGPVGMININFIREVDFYSGAFPADKGNALSSIFDFKMKDANTERFRTTATLGSSDVGLTFDTPLGKKAGLIISYRRSYLGWLFKLLELPFLPVYNDAQFKTKIRFNDKNELSVIGLGAIDDFKLNLDANKTEQQKYILGYLPVFTQWNYALGANYKHFFENSYATVVLSRNQLNNRSYKYENIDESNPSNKILDYISQEIENKFRLEDTYRKNGYKLTVGAGVENVTYTNSTYNRIYTPAGQDTIDFKSRLGFNKFSVFGQLSKELFQNFLVLSLGVRADATDYSAAMGNPLEQLSPRFSLSLNITQTFSFNANVGRYYELPSYTVMGYRDAQNNLQNKINGLKYVQCDHLVGGFEYNTKVNTKFTLEGFYKKYARYPFLLRDSISLANMGGDFGVIGNEPANSTSQGDAYGIEFMAQQKLFKGFYGILSLTFVKSEFDDKHGKATPSSWDNGAIVSVTMGKQFKKNWEIGLKWRYQGGTPYTPIDVATSSIKTVWDINGQGIRDYDLLNTQRLKSYHQLDVRVDKKLFFKKWSLDVYFDMQNVYQFKADQPPVLLLDRDANGNPQTDPSNPAAYKTKLIDNPSNAFLETLGIIVEF